MPSTSAVLAKVLNELAPPNVLGFNFSGLSPGGLGKFLVQRPYLEVQPRYLCLVVILGASRLKLGLR